MGNHHCAIQDFQEAIRIDRQYALSHFHMGVSKLKLREYEEAIVCFNDSDNLEENPAVFDGLGCCYHRKKDYDEAISFFNKAISAKPQNVEFLKNRASCYYDMHLFQDAIDDLNTALQTHSEDP
jgi:protein O-GlcNAc transferase